MAKLNTTIDNLELKSNMLKSNTLVLPELWMDSQYPSAKLLYNNRREAYPVGSILTTSTNEDPTDRIGGTWALVDKSFRYHEVTSPYRGYNSSCIADYSRVVIHDHTVSIRLTISSAAVPSDSDVKVGALLIDNCGILAYPPTYGYATPISGTNSTTNLPYKIEASGEITFLKTTQPATTDSTTFYINLTQPVDLASMNDDFCDKFYWKRIA